MRSPEAHDRVRVLIADDEALVRTGIRLILAQADDLEVVAEATDGAEAVELALSHRVDVALLDIRMPHADGIAAAARLAAVSPRTACLVLTTFTEERHLSRALAEGVAGFLVKDIPAADLIAAVRSAARGHAVVSPQMTRQLFDRYAEQEVPRAAARALVARLSAREREVLVHVGAGLANAEIAGRLHVSEGTVKADVRQILTKLDCENRVRAAIVAHEAGLLAGDGPPSGAAGGRTDGGAGDGAAGADGAA
ncbi:response regulator transcription factor [Streptomyces sp. Z26]|uniref:response regulator n=1 Tax=Streptomyces sp. Z26 TaxID=2500177 RepID=UPI000EF13942|nr:response regulator transcription factor [Streptomyces sp. Z26]RLL68083.1 DNA-binding response regulator [Streptomyces sp. Z26]